MDRVKFTLDGLGPPRVESIEPLQNRKRLTGPYSDVRRFMTTPSHRELLVAANDVVERVGDDSGAARPTRSRDASTPSAAGPLAASAIGELREDDLVAGTFAGRLHLVDEADPGCV